MKEQIIIKASLLVSVAFFGGTISAQDKTPVWGFADLHAHPAAHLGWGSDGSGNNGLFWGRPATPPGLDLTMADANADMPPCFNTYTPNNIPPAPLQSVHGAPTDIVQFVEQQQIIQQLDQAQSPPWPHLQDGKPDFLNWPNGLSVEHQQMHITAIKRAYDAGLRLMVATTGDNQVVSTLWSKVHLIPFPGPYTVPDPDPSFDYQIAVKQLTYIKSLVAANSTWMQIVKTPQEARDAINGNKLAVILGLEMDSLTAGQILDLYDNYDVRHVIPIHLANSPFGGSAVFRDEWNSNNWFLNRGFFAVNFDPSITFRLGRPNILQAGYQVTVLGVTETIPCDGCINVVPIDDQTYKNLGYDAGSGGHKNQLGISDPGAFLALMQRGMLIDVAHMSEKATEDALAMSETYGYPLMDSHTGLRDFQPSDTINERSLLPSHAVRIGNLRGVIGLGVSYNSDIDPIADFLRYYQETYGLMGGRGVALGTDANGLQILINRTNWDLDPNDYDPTKNGFNPGALFPPSNLAAGATPPSPPPLFKFMLGSRSYDLKTDGLANYGMLADFLQALSEQSKVKPAQTVAALYHSAEDVIEMWEKVLSAAPNTIVPQVTCKEPDYQQCFTTARNNFLNCRASGRDAWATCYATYHSAIGSCATQFCGKTNRTQLTVKEILLPPVDPGRFSISVDNEVNLPNVGGDADTGFVNVDTSVNPHQVQEGFVNGTQATNYTVNIAGDCQSTSGAVSGTVAIATGQQKTCTITNLGFPSLTFFIVSIGATKPFTIQAGTASIRSDTANGRTVQIGPPLAVTSRVVSVVPDDPTDTFVFSGGCAASPGNANEAQITLGPGEQGSCVIQILAPGVGGCPAGQRTCGGTLCVTQGNSCNSLCPPNNAGKFGTFCGVSPRNTAICVYPPASCP